MDCSKIVRKKLINKKLPEYNNVKIILTPTFSKHEFIKKIERN